jgi:hypothetical protein
MESILLEDKINRFAQIWSELEIEECECFFKENIDRWIFKITDYKDYDKEYFKKEIKMGENNDYVSNCLRDLAEKTMKYFGDRFIEDEGDTLENFNKFFEREKRYEQIYNINSLSNDLMELKKNILQIKTKLELTN